LISAILALAGLILSFMVRRRRVFLRAAEGRDGRTVVDVGGLARSDAAGGFEVEFAELGQELRRAQDGSTRLGVAGAAVPGDAAVSGVAVTGDQEDTSSGPVPGMAEPPPHEDNGSVSSDNHQSLSTPEGE
jgi:hypothetical protein